MLSLSRQSFSWGNTWPGIYLEQIVNSSRGKIGPIRYNAFFRLDNAGYDSDIYYGYDLDPVPDTAFTAGPSISFFLPLKNGIVFDLSENPEYVYFLSTKKERALNNRFQGRIHFALKKLYFQVGGELINAKQRIASELYVNVRRKQDNLTGLVFWQISNGSAVALQYRSSTYVFENPIDSIFNWEILNRREDYTNLTAYFQGLIRTRFFLDAEYGSFVFSQPISSQRDSRSFGIYGGIEFLPPPIGREQDTGIQGSLNLGYKRFDVLDPERKDFEGLVGNTSIAINIIKFTTIHGSFARDIQFSVYSDLAYYIQTIYGAGISRTITRRIDFAYDFSVSQNDYVEGDVSGYELGRRMLISHIFRLGSRLRENLTLNLIVRLGERANYFTELIHSRNFIGFNLRYGSSSGSINLRSSPFSR